MTSQLTSISTPCERVCFPTELGWFGFLLQHETVFAVVIGESSSRGIQARLKLKVRGQNLETESRGKLSSVARQLRDDLQKSAAGADVSYDGYSVSTDHLTPFQQRVVDTVSNIPYGRTLSYAEVANLAGSPRAARAVGNVMARNRTPIVVPCHRVLASGGKLGGFSAPGGIEFKRRLLRLEGVSESMSNGTFS